MKWQLLPLKKHILLLFSLWQTQPFKNLTFSSDLQIQKDCCCVIYPGFLNEALCLFYYAWELWLRGVKTFYCGFVCSNDQDVPTRGLCNGGGREKTVFLLRRQCSSERRELSDIENYTFTSNVLRRIPKWKQRAKSYSQKNSYISETATKHKAVSSSKVNLRTVHFLLHYPTCDRRTELCRISPYFISWRGTENGWTCKLYNLTLQTTYQTNVVSWIFICFIKRLFYRQPWTFRAQHNLCWI